MRFLIIGKNRIIFYITLKENLVNIIFIITLRGRKLVEIIF